MPQSQPLPPRADQHRLDHRHRPVVQDPGLEDERVRRGAPPEQPQRLPDQVQRQPPALVPLQRPDARRMLGDQGDRTGERGGQRDRHSHYHVPDLVPLTPAPAGYWARQPPAAGRQRPSPTGCRPMKMSATPAVTVIPRWPLRRWRLAAARPPAGWARTLPACPQAAPQPPTPDKDGLRPTDPIRRRPVGGTGTRIAQPAFMWRIGARMASGTSRSRALPSPTPTRPPLVRPRDSFAGPIRWGLRLREQECPGCSPAPQPKPPAGGVATGWPRT